jgi:starch phosphorylase
MPGNRFVVEIQPVIPERFERLGELANDLYYSWSRAARALFRRLDQESWDACGHNPRVFLRRVRQSRLDFAAQDPILLTEYRRVLSDYDTYLEQRPSNRIDPYLDPKVDLVAYFSAEFGFHESMPIYAGGLGILAGDYCKAMSNLWVPFVGVGMLYRQGYFTQRIDCAGAQIAHYRSTDPYDLPVTLAQDEAGNEVQVHVDLPGRRLALRVWQLRVGHIRLYLLDSDLASNRPEDRLVTAQLYGGDLQTRLQQEMVLGIGGVRALRALGLAPSVWHINEGHAAFLILERCLEQHTRAGIDFESALELVAAGTVFTTHTPVPAGHDVFDHDLMRHYFRGYMKRLGIDGARFLELGANPRHPDGYSMTSLAMRGSRFRNGVSRIHGEVASRMESYIWPELPPGENPVGYITNGIDVDSYLGRSWSALFEMYTGGGWRAKLTDPGYWRDFIDCIPDHVYTSTRQILKADMLEDIRRRVLAQHERCPQTKSMAERLTRHLSPRSLDTLVIGFARRFATYKRATLVFKDLQRLARLVNDPERPVLFIFAGKAHPSDQPGQQMLREIYEISLRREFQGRVILVEGYNLSVARELLTGVDVWLNNPEYPLEACGTSGMKAAINGAINLSVLDGWWAEAYDGENGWAITPHPDLDPQTREQREAEELMNILEYQVIPLFHTRNDQGEAQGWVRKSKASLKTIMPRFNSIRMAMDYLRDSYAPAARQARLLGDAEAAGARTLSEWKRCVEAAWPNVHARLVRPIVAATRTGEPLNLDVAVQLDGMDAEDVEVECVLGQDNASGEFVPERGIPFIHVGQTPEGEALFHCDLKEFEDACSAGAGGLLSFKIRLYPYHTLLSNRFGCRRMLWL